MLDAYRAFIGCITSIVKMLFKLPLVPNVSLGSFILACGVLAAVISVIFASVRAFNMLAPRSGRTKSEGSNDL